MRLTSAKHLELTPRGRVTPSPKDWRDHFIYQLLIDRFDDAREQTPAYDPAQSQKKSDPTQRDRFQGGTLRGITRRLDYIQQLGCTALWITPPLKNRQEIPTSYHGYAIQDFLAIDPRFGSLDDMRQMVQQAHARGIYVILDTVLNHTGNNWAYPNDARPAFNEKGKYEFGYWRQLDPTQYIGPDDAVWPIELQSPLCYNRRGRIRDFSKANIEEAIEGDFFSLKDLDLKVPAVLDALIACYKYWIAATDIDGFRLDAVKHIEPAAVSRFCNEIRDYAKSIGKTDFLIFGEVVDNDLELHRYITGQKCPGKSCYPKLDACLDFPLYFFLEEIIKGKKSAHHLRKRYQQLQQLYHSHEEPTRHLITFVDNHDQMARPHRRFMHNVTDPRLMMLAMGYLLTSVGIPCLYYGTEQGFNGGGPDDTYIRECMFGGTWGAFATAGVHFFNPDHPLYQHIRTLAQIRAQHPPLKYGRQEFRKISSDGLRFSFPHWRYHTLAYARIHEADELLIAMNLSPTAQRICVETSTLAGEQQIDLLTRQVFPIESSPTGKSFVRLTLPKYEMVILKRGHRQ